MNLYILSGFPDTFRTMACQKGFGRIFALKVVILTAKLHT